MRNATCRASRFGSWLAVVAGASAVFGQETLETVAGGGAGDSGPAVDALIPHPTRVALDAQGRVLVTSVAAWSSHERVRRFVPGGEIETVAGSGFEAFEAIGPIPSGDGGPATDTVLGMPAGVAVDGVGNVYFTELRWGRLRKVAPDGTITTLAGTGNPGYSGDGGPATAARLNQPQGVAVDAAGNVYVADTGNHRIRKVTPGGTIVTVAGAGTAGSSGNGGPATSALLNRPSDVAVDAAGNLLIADTSNHQIRKVTPGGTISRFAGLTVGFAGDGGTASSARFNAPNGVSVDPNGNVLVADTKNQRIRRITPAGIVSTVAGNGFTSPSGDGGFAGDGGAATAARLNNPADVVGDAAGNVYIADHGNSRVRRVTPAGTIATVAGNGSTTYAGDGLPATEAALSTAEGFDVGPDGSLYIADLAHHRVRRVSPDGRISTFAGSGIEFAANGVDASTGDGGPATAASVPYPMDVAADSVGNVYIVESWPESRVRRVSPEGVISAFAPGSHAVAVDRHDNVYTFLNWEVRRISPGGFATTVAGRAPTGDGTLPPLGDGGPATAAFLYDPQGLALGEDGSIYISEYAGCRIRKVDPTGRISTIAGLGHYAFSGDGGPATAAGLANPRGLAVDRDGGLLIADVNNLRVRRISPDGVITTIAGGGQVWYPLEGVAPRDAALRYVPEVGVDAEGRVLISDRNRIRRIARPVAIANITAPATVTSECDDDDGATILFAFDVTAGSADRLLVRDATGGRTLLDVPNPADGPHGVGPTAFPHGGSTVQIELIRGTEVVASATVAVQIEDTVAPVLGGVGPRTIELRAPLTPIAPSPLGISAADACDPAPTVVLAPGALALGTTAVTATARDATGNTSTATFDVTVVDTTPPQFLVLPADVERHCESGGALVAFDVLAEDLSGAVAVTCRDDAGRSVDPSGTRFGIGAQTVTCTATDGSGNEATHAFVVAVIDDEAPVIVVPDDVTLPTEPGECFAFVAFSVTATDECDPDAGIACESPWGPVESGDAFPCGTTTVVCTATDHAGNTATRSFHVTVRDREPPAIAGPTEVTLATDCCGAPITVSAAALGASASDNCDPAPSLVVAPSSLAPGTTEVVVTAADEDGNSSARTVRVTVLRGPFEVRFLPPLDAHVDNRIQPGRTVPVKVRVLCDNVFDAGVAVVIDRVERIDGTETPIANEVVDDAGASSDQGASLRLSGDHYVFSLSTKGWDVARGARFRVVLRVSKPGHVDTNAGVVLENR